MSLQSEPFHEQIAHPRFLSSEKPMKIQYMNESNQVQDMDIEMLFKEERAVAHEKCDSILAKIIYSQA